MKHDQVSERGVTSAHRTMEKEEEEEKDEDEEEREREREREILSLFLRVVDIRTRIRSLGKEGRRY